MSNERYQSLFALQGSALREKFLEGAPTEVVAFINDVSDEDLAPLVQNLGGHDIEMLLDAYRECDLVTDKPSVVFAYTVKGWGLPIAGDPLNHAALLSESQINDLRKRNGLTLETEWDQFDRDSEEDRVCRAVGGDINNKELPDRPMLKVPHEVSLAIGKKTDFNSRSFRSLTYRSWHNPRSCRTHGDDVSRCKRQHKSRRMDKQVRRIQL